MTNIWAAFLQMMRIENCRSTDIFKAEIEHRCKQGQHRIKILI